MFNHYCSLSHTFITTAMQQVGDFVQVVLRVIN